MPPPLDGTPFRTVPVDSASVPAVIYAGNVDPYQNLSLLLAAAQVLKRKKPGIKLLIGTAAQACIPGAEIVPVHDLEGLSQFLARDAVFAVPRVSWSGYPMKILNAMAAGKAVVACESAAYPITHDETGLVVPDDDVDAYAAALLRLVEDPHLREKLGSQARQVVLERHQPNMVARQLETLMLEAHDRYNTRVRTVENACVCRTDQSRLCMRSTIRSFMFGAIPPYISLMSPSLPIITTLGIPVTW